MLRRRDAERGNSRDAAFPVLLIVVGGVWLLYSADWLPDVHWLWILGLAGAGAAILLLDGITKSSIVSGPLLMLAGLLSYLREFHGLAWRLIIPVMLIAAGLLQLIARMPAIPEARESRRVRDESRPRDPLDTAEEQVQGQERRKERRDEHREGRTRETPHD